MENKKKSIFSKDFFTKPRPTISSKEALKDVIPINWNDNYNKNNNRKSVSSKNR